MQTLASAPAVEPPEWVAAEMPPGYQTRLAEIQRLSAELRAMDAIGRVLWQSGEPLKESVRALLGSLKYELDPAEPGAPIVLHPHQGHRLLLHVATAPGPVQKTGEDLANAFQILQFAAEGDRVVIVVNSGAETRPAQRPEPATDETLKLLRRMGVNAVETSTLFRLWRLWHEDQGRARTMIERLHAQDGGVFALPS